MAKTKQKKEAYEPDHLQIFAELKEKEAKKKKKEDKLIFIQKPALTTENVQKFKRGFKWLAFLNFLVFSFAFGLARYNGYSFYGLWALFIVTYNISIYTHFLDERIEHWLKDPSDTTNGLLVKIMAVGNVTAVVFVICVHTAQCVFPHVSNYTPENHSQELVLTLWSILRGVTADVVTMVNRVVTLLNYNTYPHPSSPNTHTHTHRLFFFAPQVSGYSTYLL